MFGKNKMLFNVRTMLNSFSYGNYLIDYTYQGKYRQGHLATVKKQNGIFKAISDQLYEVERHLLPYTRID